MLIAQSEPLPLIKNLPLDLFSTRGENARARERDLDSRSNRAYGRSIRFRENIIMSE
jgi:hypothetical protein